MFEILSALSPAQGGFLLGAVIAVPVTLVLEHWVLRPLVRLHARLARQRREW